MGKKSRKPKKAKAERQQEMALARYNTFMNNLERERRSLPTSCPHVPIPFDEDQKKEVKTFLVKIISGLDPMDCLLELATSPATIRNPEGMTVALFTTATNFILEFNYRPLGNVHRNFLIAGFAISKMKSCNVDPSDEDAVTIAIAETEYQLDSSRLDNTDYPEYDVAKRLKKVISCDCLHDLTKAVKKAPRLRICAICRKEAKSLMVCGQCKLRSYCSQECQPPSHPTTWHHVCHKTTYLYSIPESWCHVYQVSSTSRTPRMASLCRVGDSHLVTPIIALNLVRAGSLHGHKRQVRLNCPGQSFRRFAHPVANFSIGRKRFLVGVDLHSGIQLLAKLSAHKKDRPNNSITKKE